LEHGKDVGLGLKEPRNARASLIHSLRRHCYSLEFCCCFTGASIFKLSQYRINRNSLEKLLSNVDEHAKQAAKHLSSYMQVGRLNNELSGLGGKLDDVENP
jgi:hypothetical protein